MRFVVFGVAVSLLGSISAYAAIGEKEKSNVVVAQIATSERTTQIDPVVTGVRVTQAHYQKWLENKRKFETCETCALDQPFPGDEANR